MGFDSEEVKVFSDENLQIVLEKNDDDKQTSEENVAFLEPQITREEGIMTCNSEKICHEVITISE